MTEGENSDNYNSVATELNNSNDDFALQLSDEESGEGEEWEPDPHEIIELFEKLAKESVLELEWTTPGRRPPTPVEEHDFSNMDGSDGEGTREEEKTDFDFKDELSNLRLSAKSMRPRGPDAILKGSAKKKTTSLDAILSNMARHRKLDMMEDDDDDFLP